MTSTTPELPWIVAAERVYGPLADAFGLRPLRDFGHTWRDLAAAQFDETVATTQVAGVFAAGAVDGLTRLARRIDARRDGGEPISSPTALLRTGYGELDHAMTAAMMSEPGLAATAASVRATSRRRLGWQKLSAIAAESIGQPTRAEVDEAFREIQQLKRDIRELKRAAARPPAKGQRA